MPAITDWAAEDRPREKLLLKGTSALSDAALELLLAWLREALAAGRSVVVAEHNPIVSDLAAVTLEFCK
ncbi:MAG TPA: hypothetical protein PLX72_08465 [Candidatus Syntrophosphaera sp.]|nr:hypothetical protein [Candidatus Syntrophosphaera sp.]